MRELRFGRLAEDVFGSMQVLREAQRGNNSLRNAFTAFLHHLKLFGPGGVRLWITLSEEGNGSGRESLRR